ncbi:hypothetical protein GN244_ATG03165 [Phytophthora infestans]|uniref:Uncharacterized protein n=1 Tax=Phytophthora infestans TaxID=4787 RepID=A0A833SAQ4_PHYIN|nr:hypothetical protein GN244_ATG03165 [Phytophthora infestans]KAF4139624.1 hypothetical protein GN958_ATG11109 [Phytophthora infestans]
MTVTKITPSVESQWKQASSSWSHGTHCRHIDAEQASEVEKRHAGYESVRTASTAVQSTLTSLMMLKVSNASGDMMQSAQQKVDVHVRWSMDEVDPD